MIRPHPLTLYSQESKALEEILKNKFEQIIPKDSNELSLYLQKVFPTEITYNDITYDLQVISSPSTSAVKVRYSTASTYEESDQDLISFGEPNNPERPFIQMILRLFENNYANTPAPL